MGTATQPPARPQSGGETKPPCSSDREGETDGDGDATRGQPPSPKATCRPGAVTRSQMSQLASPCPCQPWGRARRRGKGQGTAVPRVTGSCFPRRWMGRVRPRILEAWGSATAPRSAHASPPVPRGPGGPWGALSGCRPLVRRGATRAGTHLGTIGRCSAPGWPASVGACGSGGRGQSRDPRLRPKSRRTPRPLSPRPRPALSSCPRAGWPRAGGGPVGTWGAEPCPGRRWLLNQHLPGRG